MAAEQRINHVGALGITLEDNAKVWLVRRQFDMAPAGLKSAIGVRLAHAMNPGPLKKVFAVFLTLVALNMLRKSLGF